MNKLPMAQRAKVRDSWGDAREWVQAGNVPADILMTNKKTGFSIMDNVPQITCFAQCPVAFKCYDVHLMKIRPTVLTARARRHAFMLSDPDKYADHAIAEIELLRLKKGVDKIRVYTGGDFHPAQMPIFRKILSAVPSVTFYMISKMIRGFKSHAEELLTYPNFFLCLSEMEGFEFSTEWNSLRKHARVNSVYTLMPNEKDLSKALAADIVFNVSKKAADIQLYKTADLPLCPCDAKDIPSKGACDACGLCATKGGVKYA